MSDEKNEIQTDGEPEEKPSWRFPRTFWTGNASELCERAAYYLIRVVGLDDVQAGVVAGLFGGWIYLVPFFTGAAADRMGFRKALILAFALLTVGYGTLGVFHTLGPVLVGLAPAAGERTVLTEQFHIGFNSFLLLDPFQEGNILGVEPE